MPQTGDDDEQKPKPKAGYYPDVAGAAQESNDIDDKPPRKFILGRPDLSHATNPEAARLGDYRGEPAKEYVQGQEQQKLRNMLPGMTDYGIDQVKKNVRLGRGVGSRFSSSTVPRPPQNNGTKPKRLTIGQRIAQSGK